MKILQSKETYKFLSGTLLLAILTIGCKNKQAPQAPPTRVTTRAESTQATVRPENSSITQKAEETEKVEESPKESSPKGEKASTLLVSFYSIGGGIDVKNAQSFDNFISEYKTQSGKSVAYERVPWGREGELDYCVSFADFKPEETEKFIDASKAKIQDCKMVHFKINGECKRKR
jgi:hypothetical protein